MMYMLEREKAMCVIRAYITHVYESASSSHDTVFVHTYFQVFTVSPIYIYTHIYIHITLSLSLSLYIYIYIYNSLSISLSLYIHIYHNLSFAPCASPSERLP